METTSVPLKDKTGKVNSVLSVTRDITAAVEAELNLQRTKQNREALINGTTDMIWSLDANFCLITANNTFLENITAYSGIKLKEGDSVLIEGIDEDMERTWREHYVRGLSGESFDSVFEYTDKNSNLKQYNEISFRPIYDPKKNIIGLACRSKDITEVTHQKLDLEESNKALERILESSIDVICTILPNGSFAKVSVACKRIWGYSVEEVTEKKIFDFVYDEDRKETKSIFQSIIQGTGPTSFENRFLTKEGSIVNLIWSASWDNKEQKIYCIARDATDRINSERATKLSEKKYKSLFDLSPMPKFIYEVSTLRILDCNVSSSEHYGYTNDELKGFTILDLFKDEDKKSFEEMNSEIFINDKKHSLGTFSQITKSGNLIRAEIVGHKFEFNGIVSALIVCIDITEQEKNLHALLASEARYRGFYESQTNYIIRTDLQGRYSYYNKKFADDFAWIHNDEEILGRYSLETVKEYDHEKVKLIASECIQNPGKVFKVEIDKPKKNGAVVTTLWDFLCISDENGNPTEIQCVGVDISERIEFERALIKANERYAYVTRATSDAIWDFDIVNQKLYWGEGFKKLFGLETENVDKNYIQWISLIHPEDVYRVLNKFKSLQNNTANFWQLEYRFKKIDGEYAHVLDRAYILRNQNSEPVRIIGAMQDITDEKNMALQKKLMADISIIFQGDEPLKFCLDRLLARLADFGNYDIAEIWIPSQEQTKLNLISNYALNELGRKFYQNSIQITKISLGEGLPGSVWQNKKSELWEGITQQEKFIRKESAKLSELNVMFGIPLLHNEKVVGVLVLGSSENKQKIAYYGDLLKQLETYLGAEIKRKLLELELQQMFNYAPDIICIAGFDGYYKKINPAATDLLGYSEEEFLSQPFLNFIHPDDRDLTWGEVENLTTGKLTYNFLNRQVSKTGKVIWLNWTATPYPEEGVSFAVAKDVTEAKELSQLLDKATNLAKIGSWELNLETSKGTSMFWSKMTREILEVGNEYNASLTGGFEFYVEESRTKIESAVDELIKNGKEFDLELLLLTAKNNYKWVRCIGQAEFFENRCKKIFGSFQDVHQRKIAELELAETSKRVTQTLESIQDGFYALDVNWNVTYWNHEAERMLKVKREEIIGKNIWDYFPEALQTKIFAEYEHAIRENKPVRFESYFEPLKSHYDISAFPSETGLTVYFKDITNRKLAEYELLRFKQIIDNSLDGIAIADHTGKTIYLNPAFENSLGFTTEQLLATEKKITVYKDSKKAEEVFSTLLSGKYWSGDIELLNTSGETLYFYLSGGPVFDENGKLISIYGIHTDISQRKQAELDLKNAFLEKQRILESIGDGFITINSDWTVTYFNKAAEQILNIDRMKIIGKNIWDVFPEAKESIFASEYERVMKTGVSSHFEGYYQTLDLWVDISAYPAPNGLSIFFKNISEKKKAERDIHESNERFQKAAQATNDAIWDWDIEKDFVYFGNGFQILFGTDHKETNGNLLTWASTIHPDDYEQVMISLYNSLKQNGIFNWQSEFRYKKADGNYADVINRGLIIRSNDGTPVRMVAAITDISYRKLYEESLKNLNKALSKHAKELEISNAELEQFAYVASHDLQEPLRMVTSFLTQLEKKYSSILDEKAKQYIHFAVDGATRMRQIILDLLQFSRVGRLDEEKENINLNELVNDYELLRNKLLVDKEAIIERENLPVIFQHRAPITQVFHNLLDNALKYSKEGVPPKIIVSASEKERHWEISISDNGIGIEPEYFEKIFVIFQRLHGKDEFEGTGMGLAIVKKIIKTLEGNIWLESELGKGSTFYFTINKGG
ncbi:PAS domain S-box protein [Leptospira sp. 96542]|nr:PAS domain S-box protein [Leptospira sp. 96542]